MSYTDKIFEFIKGAVEIIPSIGPMLRAVNFEDYLPIGEIFNYMTQKFVSGDGVFNSIVDYISSLSNNNIFTCIRARIIAERLRLTTLKSSKKRLLFLELEHKFSKLKWSMNMTIEELNEFTIEFEKIYYLIEKSFEDISEKPKEIQKDTIPNEFIFHEEQKYKTLYNFYETDLNVYKNLMIDLVFFTKSQYENYKDNDNNKYKDKIIEIFSKICLEYNEDNEE